MRLLCEYLLYGSDQAHENEHEYQPNQGQRLILLHQALASTSAEIDSAIFTILFPSIKMSQVLYYSSLRSKTRPFFTNNIFILLYDQITIIESQLIPVLP